MQNSGEIALEQSWTELFDFLNLSLRRESNSRRKSDHELGFGHFFMSTNDNERWDHRCCICDSIDSGEGTCEELNDVFMKVQER